LADTRIILQKRGGHFLDDRKVSDGEDRIGNRKW
jgi:hypothetical protein